MRSPPANASLGNGSAAIVGDIAAALSGSLRDVRNGTRRHRRRRYVLACGETHFIAIACALAVRGKSPHIISGVSHEASHVGRE